MKIVHLVLNNRCNLSVSDADISSDIEPYLVRQTIIPEKAEREEKAAGEGRPPKWG